LLIQFIRSYPPYRRPFLYPQPEDAPCRGDRDPLTQKYNSLIKRNVPDKVIKLIKLTMQQTKMKGK